MKTRNLMIGMLFTAALLLLASCTKTDNDYNGTIEGIYYGTLVRTTSLKLAQTHSGAGDQDTAEVTMMGENLIEVHCHGDEIDTTFMLDFYLHNDSVLVCLTGDDFENMYGHMPGSGHMGGGMMGDMGSDETEWMHHLSDEHEAGDEHFGAFDLRHGTFTYSIRMTDETEPYYMRFSGSKAGSVKP